MSFIKQSFINSLLSDIDILRIIEPHVQSVHTNAAQYSQTQRLTDQQSRQTDRLTNRQTNRQKDRKTAERQTADKPTDNRLSLTTRDR